jgi:mitogen-activated protein kinase 1/3
MFLFKLNNFKSNIPDHQTLFPLIISKKMESLPSWDLMGKYSLLKRLGKGSYGSVCLGRSNRTGQIVAIKSIKGIFDRIYDAKRILREICIMRVLNHPDIVKIIEVIVTERSFRTIYIVMESAQSDLKKVLKSPVYLGFEQVRYMMYQAVCGLRYMHSANILHRDLKPANILINEDCSIKICDFGLSRSYIKLNRLDDYDNPHAQAALDSRELGIETAGRLQGSLKKRELTVHVVTRWYRAPELILLEKEYNKEIDIWSLGCVFAEMLSLVKANVSHYIERGALFPGMSCFPLSPDTSTSIKRAGYPCAENDQLNVIFDVIGTPDPTDLDFITDPKAQQYVDSFPRKAPKPLTDFFPACGADELDILSRMLVFNPRRRISLDQLVAHRYFDSVRDVNREILADARADFIFDSQQEMSVEQLQEIFSKEIMG